MEKAYELRDYLTFKFQAALKYKKYAFGGIDQGGNRCIITKYGKYLEKYKCYNIEVMFLNLSKSVWNMLESEFEEYELVKARKIIYE